MWPWLQIKTNPNLQKHVIMVFYYGLFFEMCHLQVNAGFCFVSKF